MPDLENDPGAPADPARRPPDANRPSYAAAFRCIGASCEDTCCHGWSIPLDQRTYEKYKLFPADRLGSIVQQYVTIVPAAPESLHARINLAASGSCPFHGPDLLCGIQKEYGGELLSRTCSLYPRALNTVDGVLEGSLMLSCPEAARNVLLIPNSTEIEADLLSGDFRTDNVFHLAGAHTSSIHKPYAYFHQVRWLLTELVQDRSRPLWQRLLLIGSLCKRLDGISSAEQDATVPAMLEEYRQVIANQWLHAELEALPGRPALKLKVIFQLTDGRLQDKTSGPRFQDVFWTFVEGIAPSPDEPGSDDVQRFVAAERKYHRPFFEKRPHILENYLLNYMYQTLFPFGREGSPTFTPQGIFDEYVLMTTQFAWVDALLVGAAGRHKEAFAEEHVVQTVQAFTRATEHYAYVLKWINEEMKKLKLDSIEGMAVLLKTSGAT